MNNASHWSQLREDGMPVRDVDPALRASVSFAADGTTQVAVAGEVDFWTGQRLDEALSWAADQSGGKVVVDLRGVTFAGAACVDILVAARDRLGRQHRPLWLKQVPPRTSRLFALCGAHFVIAAPDPSPVSASVRSDPRGQSKSQSNR